GGGLEPRGGGLEELDGLGEQPQLARARRDERRDAVRDRERAREAGRTSELELLRRKRARLLRVAEPEQRRHRVFAPARRERIADPEAAPAQIRFVEIGEPALERSLLEPQPPTLLERLRPAEHVLQLVGLLDAGENAFCFLEGVGRRLDLPAVEQDRHQRREREQEAARRAKAQLELVDPPRVAL